MSKFKLLNNEVEVIRVNNDVNGNPRYVFHFSNVSSYLKAHLGELLNGYDFYILSANASGCKKYHNRSYGGGLLFQSYNVQDSLQHVERSIEQYIEDFKTRIEKENIGKAIEACNLNAKLVKAYKFEDIQEMKDIASHGYSSGVSGFIYYSETSDFWKKHKKAIITTLQDEISGYSEKGFIESLNDFNSLKDYSTDEIGQAIFGRYNSELDVIYNQLVWACGENLAYRISEYVENDLSND